jgi:hypothetical protein
MHATKTALAKPTWKVCSTGTTAQKKALHWAKSHSACSTLMKPVTSWMHWTWALQKASPPSSSCCTPTYWAAADIDTEGRDYWINQVTEEGVSLEVVADAFVASEELQEQNVQASDWDFLI